MSRSYTKEQLETAVKNSFSYRQTLLKLGLRITGNGYPSLKRAIKEYQIDISHFTGQRSGGWKTRPKRDIEDYLSNKQYISPWKLKKKLIKLGLLQNECSICKITDWMNQIIELQIHHIDGNSMNNNFSNLCLLCPNCHSQTENYGAKNKKRKIIKSKSDKKCEMCDNFINKASKKYCSNLCRQKASRNSNKPSYEQLKTDVENLGYSATGRKYNVTDNSIRAWLKLYQQEL